MSTLPSQAMDTLGKSTQNTLIYACLEIIYFSRKNKTNSYYNYPVGVLESQDPLEGIMSGRPLTEAGSSQAMDTAGKYNKQYRMFFSMINIPN